jgi:hypothetical protein
MTSPAFVPHISTTLHHASLHASAREVDEEMRYVNFLTLPWDVLGRVARRRGKRNTGGLGSPE